MTINFQGAHFPKSGYADPVAEPVKTKGKLIVANSFLQILEQLAPKTFTMHRKKVRDRFERYELARSPYLTSRGSAILQHFSGEAATICDG
ncbi:hypothetical protein ACJKIH_23650 [Brucella pseudogrignonensis]|uniref:hypothetical protein n=1 Tax=Brucella pseudogrignonensis TaxID=419475 RepID=UPI0038B4423A